MTTRKTMTLKEIAEDNARIASAQVKAADTLPASAPVSPKHKSSIGDRILRGINWQSAPDIPATEPMPSCKKCDGRGYFVKEFYRNGVRVKHPDDGKTFPCDEPGCLAVQRNQRMRMNNFIEKLTAHFPDRIEHKPAARLSDYSPKNSAGKLAAVEVARFFVAHHQVEFQGRTKNSLLFIGEAAKGKTHILSAIRNELFDQGQLVWFNRLITMLKAVQTGYDPDAELDHNQVEEMMCNAPFLVIDEFDMYNMKEDKLDILEAIIDSRYANRKPTVFATNLHPTSLKKKFGSRIESRMLDMSHVLEVAGKSMRDDSGYIISDKDLPK